MPQYEPNLPEAETRANLPSGNLHADKTLAELSLEKLHPDQVLRNPSPGDPQMLVELPLEKLPTDQTLVESSQDSSPADKITSAIESSSPQAVWPPVRQDYRIRSRLPTVTTMLLGGLALLLIVSGLAFVVYSTTIQYHKAIYTQATVYIQLTKHAAGTAQAHANATAQILNTAQAGIDATATSQANATAVVDNATATATSLGDLYTQATGGTPVFNDPLTDNTGDGKWDVGSSATNTGCTFTDNAYHVQEAQKGLLLPCIAEATKFSNFAYQVSMTVNKGSGGQAGLIFRIDNTNKAYYFFHIGTDGSYAFDVYKNNGQVNTLTKGFQGAITTGLGQSNQIAVVARSNMVYLFVNGQYIDAVTDTTFTLGKVGVAVVDTNTPVDVQFSDAQVWNLSASSSS